MHTSGQAYAMAFQAGGPHAQDRALEAVAYSLAEMTRHASQAVWEKPQGKRPPQRMTKTFTVAPRGVALVIGCNTFPTWNSYPGLFASLVTGNAVVVKPHHGAVLPLAITVSIAREVLTEAGFSPDLVTLAAEAPGERLAKVLALRPEVKVIDYTGSTAFGTWLEQNAHQASVFTEKAGVNAVVIDSTDDYRGMLANLAFSLSLYSGQMCTTPQNLLVPRDGITADGEHKSVDELAADLAAAVDGLLGDEARAVALLGAVVNDGVIDRLELAPSYGKVVLASRAITHPDFPDATVRTPTVVQLDESDSETYLQECFGPVAFLVTTDSTSDSIRILRDSVREHGAITAAVYSTRRGGARGDRAGSPRRRRRAVVQPDRDGVRQPVRRVLRLPRDGRQPRSQREPHRRRVRRQPVPHRAVAAPPRSGGRAGLTLPRRTDALLLIARASTFRVATPGHRGGRRTRPRHQE